MTYGSRMRLLLVLLACSFAVGCATSKEAAAPAETPAPAAEAPPEQPKVDLEAMAAREAAPLARKQVQSPDGVFKLTAELSGEPTFTAEGEGMHSVTLPVGTGGPLSCYVYQDRIDPAGALSTVVASIGGGPAKIQRIVPMEVAVVAERPVMFLRLDYVAQTEQGLAAGQVKLAATGGETGSLMCVHDELGYSKSFVRWVSGIVETLERPGVTEEKPKFREVQVTHMNELPVGFSERVFYVRKDGRVLETYSSMLLPRTQTEVVASDSASAEKVDAKGLLTEVVYFKSMNNEVSSQLTLKKGKKGSYQYSGTWETKPLEGTFTSKAPLQGDVLHWQKVRELFKGKKESVSLPSYSPSTDPTNVSTVIYRKDPSLERGLTIEVGPVSMKAVADEHGMMQRSELSMGRVNILSERTFLSGAP